MGYAGIKPDVQDIGFLDKLPPAAGPANSAFRNKKAGVFFKPDVCAVLAKRVKNTVCDFTGDQNLITVFAVKNGIFSLNYCQMGNSAVDNRPLDQVCRKNILWQKIPAS